MSESRWSGEAKYRALLAVAEEANSRRDLPSALDAVAAALTGLVPIDGIGVITREGETLRTLAIHHPREPRRDDESSGEYVRRITEARGVVRDRGDGPLACLEQTSQTLVIDDVQQNGRFPEDAALKRSGAECLVLAPLTMGTHFVGGIAFVRMSHTPFSRAEVGSSRTSRGLSPPRWRTRSPSRRSTPCGPASRTRTWH